MKMKVDAPFKFKFFKQDTSLKLRQTFKEAKYQNKERIKKTISDLFES